MTAPQNGHLPALKFLAITHVIVIALYFGLIGTGTWRTDEYSTLTQYRDRGLEFLAYRITHWSPRPFSEAIIFVYSTIVNATHFQLTTAALFITWTGLLSSIALPFFAFNNSQIHRHARVLIVALPITLTLSLASTGEVFYWPFGAFAYMPTISTLAIMFGLAFW
ncbi:MAG TPA: hypothetical protein VFY35_02275, partial [Burkholderiaceae bacterium]|nr:hypothetical protein [Burkholderiaceae bacterium]